MTDPNASVGPRLKAERERRNLSAQKAADELHLDAWVIDALEAEDYERIGPSVYAKGHLKRYAALLGLPAAEIVQGYDSRAHVAKPPAAPSVSVNLRSDEPAVGNLPWPQVVGGVAVALLVIGVLWWKPWHQRGNPRVAAPAVSVHPGAAPADGTENSAGASPADGAAIPPVSATATASTWPISPPASPAPSIAAGAGAAPVAPAGQASAPDANPTAGMGHARLRLSFSADSWVDVRDAAGRRAFAGNGRANSVRTVAGMAPMRVYLGFASGVQLEINNRAVAIGPQFVAGDVARFEAGADGVLRRDSHGAATPGAVAPPGAVAAPGVQSRNVRPSG